MKKPVVKDIVEIVVSGRQGVGKSRVQGAILRALRDQFPKLEIVVSTTNEKLTYLSEDSETVE